MTKKNIAIASDHAGFELKEILKQKLGSQYNVVDLGTHSADSVDYPDYAFEMARWLKKYPGEQGILVCGSGQGICMAANRHSHVRAALCRSVDDAEMARKHNDANVICLGGRPPFLNEEVALASAQTFMTTAFEAGRHQGRVDKMGACGARSNGK